MLQILQEFFAEAALGVKVVDVAVIEVKVLDVVDDLFQSCRDGKAAAVGHRAEENVEVANLVLHSRLKIAVAHGQFVKVAEHGMIERLCHKNRSFRPMAV